ncbi:TetR/AcrR family transcriptional regulator [Meridianimarinicoccus aquatilis]|uniref:TetR/AcrR family transcriptional regulator n=1 Tax=Meridianimarinicoccus aquatilis TaxID=2552766 RepID=A0A4R6ANZ9_9RHOB|nr:TetR/AcrR family transcriptional regulator [Fluviibacterium aquatile]QIE40844.1 TetR/AcrR family transcriptional regulator [Rhodobacteraceae bacterium SC52]TDL85800.1 TetR/AcrR family transcriptional regulator [Fluviibacterium aquatile]
MNNQSPKIKKGRKFDQVVAGARDVFMREGYTGASVDSIAKAAGVSKATLYSYFPDKKLLFLEVAKTECLRQSETAMVQAHSGASTEETLTDIARRMTGFVLSEFGQQVFRICVAESERFPELGRTFYRSGPELARARVVEFLNCATERGDLAIEDVELAADQFAELCKADLFQRVVFNMPGKVTQPDLDRVIKGAVQMFMARYGTSR